MREHSNRELVLPSCRDADANRRSKLPTWQRWVPIAFVTLIMLTSVGGSASAQSVELDDPFDVDITGTFEFEVGCTAWYGIDDGYTYAYIYLTIEGEPQWSEYIEWYGINSRYMMKKVQARTYNRDITCEVSGNLGYATAQGTILAGCNNTVRDDIADEYGTYGSSTIEFCGSIKHFPSSYQYAPHFNWGELNGYFTTGNPHTNYGLIRSALVNGLEATRSNYGSSIYLSGAYRCPHGNASVGGATNSRHMYGRAADMYNNSCKCWTQTQFNVLKAAADATGPVESLHWTTYADRHYHAAW